jgi:asparagine synthase (glutamine-hydrolysing)
LHRAALRRIIPPETLTRRKLGFETPVSQWFKDRWEPRLPEWLWGTESFLPTVMNVEAVQRIWHEHCQGSYDHQRRLYTLLALEFWARAFL